MVSLRGETEGIRNEMEAAQATLATLSEAAATCAGEATTSAQALSLCETRLNRASAALGEAEGRCNAAKKKLEGVSGELNGVEAEAMAGKGKCSTLEATLVEVEKEEKMCVHSVRGKISTNIKGFLQNPPPCTLRKKSTS